MKHKIARTILVGGAAGSVLFSGVALALDWNVTGFVRQEIAWSMSQHDNPNNTSGRPRGDQINPHLTSALYNAGNAAASTSVYTQADTGWLGGLFASGALNGAGKLPAGAFTSSPVGCWFGRENAIAAGSTGFAGTGTFLGVLCPNGTGTAGMNLAVNPAGAALQAPNPQGAATQNGLRFNMFNTRVDVDVNLKISSEFAAFMKVRGYFDGTRHFADDGRFGDNFGNPFYGDRAGTPMEYNSPDFLVDIPALYLDWNRGPLWVRLGNQTIAWGEAYFFRISDVANGLDLRRHLVLTPGAEEYQDQRIAAPGVRVSYTFNNGWELDSFVQLFQPTLLPGSNTAYNLVNTGVWVDEEYEFDDAKGTFNFGGRLNMPLSEQFTAMVGFANRRNPDGVFTSVDAPTFHNGLPNPFCLGANNDTNNLLSALGLQGARAGLGIPEMPTRAKKGRLMANGCGSAYGVDPQANGSLQFWDAISAGRIDSGKYAIASINEWPASKWATRDIFGFGNEQTFADLYRTLEGFRSNFGGITQWVGREFKRENVFFVGANYITQTEDQSSFFDSIIIRAEVSVTPDKKLFNDLSLHFTEKDDIVSALIFEKYHRIDPSFPATYLVLQWMHRTATDMFGRDLDKNNGPTLDEFIDSATGAFKPKAYQIGGLKPKGSDSADYVVFAFQQPFPNLVWRMDLSLMVDTAGGFLIQPGVRYRPSANWQWDLYANVIESPGGNNDTITETLDFGDEIFVRATRFF